MLSTRFPIIVAQFRLEGHLKGADYKHWSLAVLESRQMAHVYDVQGASSSFTYDSRTVDSFARSPDIRGGYLVGYIAREDLTQWLTEKLREIEVKRYDADWDCQSWVMDALRLLKDLGADIITESIGRGDIMKELDKEEERWELTEDVVYERLFPES